MRRVKAYSIKGKTVKAGHISKSEKDYVRLLLTGMAIVMTFILAVLLLGIRVKGNDNLSEASASYYHEMEARFTDVLEKVLAENDLYDAGINISSVIDVDGNREYTVVIHHRLIGYMSDEDMDQLMSDLNGLPFADASVPVHYSVTY